MGQDSHAGNLVPVGLSDEHGEDMKNFSKNTANKSPRRIHRNIGGRMKGTLPGVPDNKGFGRHKELPNAVADQMDWVKRETSGNRDRSGGNG